MSEPKETSEKISASKIAGIVSAVLWIVGFALAFVIPADNPLMWVPDALLLIGFFPLLFFWKPSWPWLVFGVSNIIIGFVLLVGTFIPVDTLTTEMNKAREQLIAQKSPYVSFFSEASTQQMAHVHTHLVKQHSPWTWMIIGIASTIYGIIRMVKNMIKWAAKKKTGSQ